MAENTSRNVSIIGIDTYIVDRRDSAIPDYTPTPKASISVPSEDSKTANMTSQRWGVIDQNAEDELHAKRLLNIEQAPFNRVKKRLLTPSTPIHEYLRRTPIDAPSTAGEVVSEPETEDSDSKNAAYLNSLTIFQKTVIHDFTSLIQNLARLQLSLTANESERARYTSEAEEVAQKHITTRAETASLRTHLTQAREQLEIRKGYDLIAEKVLWVDGKVGGTKSKTREELDRESEKLRAEIDELERESDELNAQWAERRHGLSEVKIQAGRLRRIVRGEVEHEHDEDARSDADEGRENDDEHEDHPTQSHHDITSNIGTPRLEDAGTPLPVILEPGNESAVATPLPVPEEMDVSTPEASGGVSTQNEAYLDSTAGAVPEPDVNDTEMLDEAEKAGMSEIDDN